MSNKVKKQVRLFLENKETGVRELDAVGLAAHLCHVSLDDYLRAAVLNYTAGVIQRELDRRRGEQVEVSNKQTEVNSDDETSIQQSDTQADNIDGETGEATDIESPAA